MRWIAIMSTRIAEGNCRCRLLVYQFGYRVLMLHFSSTTPCTVPSIRMSSAAPVFNSSRCHRFGAKIWMSIITGVLV